MKQKLNKVFSLLLIVVLFSSNTLNVFASEDKEIFDGGFIQERGRQTITIPALNSGEKKISGTRSGNNTSVKVNCYAVYPIDTYEEDNFTKIRVKIREASNLQAMSNEVVLTEGKGAEDIKLYDSMLSKKDIKFCFYGNSENYGAKTDVGYDAL